ncbi:MAG: hypothetical protein HKP58_04210 [Desulfatitalea sp.]|nr:hypothetical protein [Desulfatitalea sp.]NNJ99596.1 hypothetical protein [Desulfatitalea sp.]
MENRSAIISFSQSEKVKSGLIWCTQSTHLLQNLPHEQRRGALLLLQALIAMISTEVQTARQASGDSAWLEVDKCILSAKVMVDSGVAEACDFHFTQALSRVNTIGQKAMAHLVAQGLM